jgi:tetratricopeptide (TPR) repeat protein
MAPITLCLNMIVKNESRIITRLLESVLSIIDTYIICDTGSTDDTVNIIRQYFDSKGIPGEVIQESFKNFGYNRTFALKAAKDKATYALLLDADMIFKIEPSFNKQSLTADSYQIIQKGGSLSYYNTRLIRLDINATCIGPTHEYYDLPSGSRNEKLESIWIADIGDGGAKADKFERDIRLLKQGIEEEPNGKSNGRYYFYLANSYFNTGRHEESIPYYRRRIEIGGWQEEVFYAHLNLGHAYKSIGKEELAIITWMDAYNLHPQRSETIYEITKYYREKGKNKIGMAFCQLGKNIPYPKNDSLFIHTDVYETGFDYELSILGYYNNYPNLHKIVSSLMNRLPGKYDNLLSNYKFCYPKLSKYQTNRIGGVPMKDIIDICGTKYEMNGSNPSIFRVRVNDNTYKYMINIRFVNYYLNSNGSYHFPIDDGKIATVNKIYELDENLNLSTCREPICLVPGDNSMQLRYLGMEDLKPFQPNIGLTTTDLKLAFLGTVQSPRTNNISIGYGEIDLDNIQPSLNYSVVETQWNKGCEKNWVFFGENKVIYQWYPLIIGNIVKRQNETTFTPELFFEVSEQKSMPEFFRHTRGSTHGCEFENEIWFLCHLVEYCQPREYYHFFVVFTKEIENGKNNDKNTIKLSRWSNPFKFEGEKIEYSLGLIVEEKRILISYSKWDREPTIGVYDKFKVEMEMFD